MTSDFSYSFSLFYTMKVTKKAEISIFLGKNRKKKFFY